MNAVVDFDTLYRDPDPFRYRASWYERRKRDLLLAMLPQPRYRSGWEWGCSNGELTALLARRCDRLLATDVSRRAVRLAHERTGDLPGVHVQVACHPQVWPADAHDLIVFSEVGYYVDDASFRISVARFHAAVSEGSTLVACHWKPDFDGAFRSGAAVHRALAETLGDAVWHYEDQDFILEGWWTQPRSLAALEARR